MHNCPFTILIDNWPLRSTTLRYKPQEKKQKRKKRERRSSREQICKCIETDNPFYSIHLPSAFPGTGKGRLYMYASVTASIYQTRKRTHSAGRWRRSRRWYGSGADRRSSWQGQALAWRILPRFRNENVPRLIAAGMLKDCQAGDAAGGAAGLVASCLGGAALGGPAGGGAGRAGPAAFPGPGHGWKQEDATG
jgi:hypothetical protein